MIHLQYAVADRVKPPCAKLPNSKNAMTQKISEGNWWTSFSLFSPFYHAHSGTSCTLSEDERDGVIIHCCLIYTLQSPLMRIRTLAPPTQTPALLFWLNVDKWICSYPVPSPPLNKTVTLREVNLLRFNTRVLKSPHPLLFISLLQIVVKDIGAEYQQCSQTGLCLKSWYTQPAKKTYQWFTNTCYRLTGHQALSLT